MIGAMSAEENVELVRRLVDEVWNEHDAAAISEYFDGRLQEEISGHYEQLLTAFPDCRVTIDDLFAAEGDRVVARLTVSGTHTGGPLAGVPATRKFASWGSIRIYRIEDGKVAETWAMQDRLGLLQQLVRRLRPRE
jgi:steroid delta-isomerase-like uncharacterized protein